MKILITGSAGFIGFHVSKFLLEKKNIIFGIDNLNSYYDIKLKRERLNILKKYKKFIFFKIDINNKKKIENILSEHKIKYVIHLAAQAGVRYSILKPDIYFKNNITGFFNILDACKNAKIKHLIYASTSSVYGNDINQPSKESNCTDFPQSFYAATKKSNEVLAYAYSNIYNIPTTGIRFFTVYGSYGRPDMALFKFAKTIKQNRTISLYNYGNHTRDYTHVSDVVIFLSKLIKKNSIKKPPFQIFNIARSKPQKLKYFIALIEKFLNKKAKKKYIKLQKGDVKDTFGENKKITKKISKHKFTDINEGLEEFFEWFNKKY